MNGICSRTDDGEIMETVRGKLHTHTKKKKTNKSKHFLQSISE